MSAPQNCCVQAPPLGAQMPQLALQQNWPLVQVLLPHLLPPPLLSGTQAQTLGELSQWLPWTQSAF